MVSFQCHGCGDVVKKPKLDQHRTRCHSGYDCIDCSKTFNTPADYRGHTSCISEAEKYEKSLYKGPKTGAPPIKDKHNTLNSNSKPHHLAPTKHKHTASTHKAPEVEGPATPAIERHSNAQWGAKSVGSSGAVAPAPSNSYGGGRGGQAGGGYGRYGGWGVTRNKVTGANDTPLGTPPPRASPVNVAAPRTAAAAAAAQANGCAETQTQKDKRRKSGAADDEAVNGDAKSNKKAKIWKEKDDTVDPASIPLPSSPVPPADDGKKKSKKDKDAEKEKKKLKKDKAKKLEEETVDVEMGLSGEEEKKKSKKDKKEKQKEVLVGDEDGEKTKADKKKKKKDAFEESTPQTNGIEVNGKDRKRKRSDDDDAADAGADASLVGEKKKKKKEKKEKPSEDAMDVDAKPMVESTKKEKKNKKEKKDKVAKSIPVAVAVS